MHPPSALPALFVHHMHPAYVPPPHPLRRGGDSCVSVCLCMDGTLVQMWWKTWDSRPGWGWSGGVVEWRGWVYSGCGRVGTFGAAPLRSAKEDKSPSPRWFESFSATEGVDVLLAAWMQVRCPVRGDCRMTTPQRTRWSCPSPLRSSLVGVFGYPASTVAVLLVWRGKTSRPPDVYGERVTSYS
jgi:hypothetical protein